MQLEQIQPGMFLLPGANDGQYPFSHSVLIDSDVVCLIDAGCGLAALERVLEIATPDLIIATHGHPDHISGCWMFPEVPVHAPVMIAEDFGRIDRMAPRYAPPALRSTYRALVQGSMGFESRPPDETYDAGSAFDFGQARLVAIHTPGHTEDHMSFFDTTTGILVAGDIDLSMFGPWYGDVESDITRFEDSIRALMDLEPRVVVTGHGGIFRDNLQKRFQHYLDIIRMRHGAIAELIRSEQTLDDLVAISPIYRGRPYPAALSAHWERTMIEKHLELLMLEGRAHQTGKGWVKK